MISVIVPVYNVEKYISKCIESIINQSYSDLEVLLVDDGSTDLSGKICDDFAVRDSRIKVFHQSNKGVSAARNVGLSNARGEIISFVDADDYLDVDMYRILTEDMELYHVGIAMCDYHGNGSEKKKKSGVFKGEDMITALYTDFYNTAIVVWNKLYKRELFNNVRFPEDCIYEDEYIMHELFFYAQKISSNNKKLYFYTKREGSITNENKINVENRLGALENRMNFCKANDIIDGYYFTMLRYFSDSVRLYFYDKSRGKDTQWIIKKFEEHYFEFNNMILWLKTKQHKSMAIYLKISVIYLFYQWCSRMRV